MLKGIPKILSPELLKVLCALMLSVSSVGCGSNDTGSSTLSGKVTLDGSTSMEKFVNGLKEAMNEKYPSLTLEPQFTGSGTGIKSVIAGSVDIGNSSRALKDEEKTQGAVENIVAIDGIAIIVSNSNTVTNLTTEQLAKIYKGEIRNWNEVGGDDVAIVVVGREASSGTRGAFEEILGIEEQCQYSNELNETGAVVAKVQEIAGAIGYVSLDIAEDNTDKVKTLALNDVVPSKDTIKDGSYTLQRPFVMATKGTIDEQSEQVKAVFDYIYSDEGTALIEQLGLVSTK